MFKLKVSRARAATIWDNYKHDETIRYMTQFQDKVRQIVRKIPNGTVLTYKQVAYAAGKPGAARAVANTMANNYDTTVPCHRVIRSDGKLGGYNRGGIEEKRSILMSEGYNA